MKQKLFDKPVKVETRGYKKVKSIDKKKFSIWYDVNGCGETTLAITPLKSTREANAIKKQILDNESDILFWQGELLRDFGEVNLIEVIHQAKKLRNLISQLDYLVSDIYFNGYAETTDYKSQIKKLIEENEPC